MTSEHVPSPRLRRNFLLAAPLILLTPVSFGLLLQVWDEPLAWKWVGLGAAGWTVALTLRLPVALFARRLGVGSRVLQRLVVVASGPAEETTRLVVLILAGREFAVAYSIGLGWGGVEVVYAVLNSGLALWLARGTGRRAERVRHQLGEARDRGLFTDAGPILGIAERLSANAIHLGFTLLLAHWPLLLVGTIPIHSGINLVAVALARRSLVGTEAFVAAVGAALFLGGLAAFGKV